MARTLRSIPHWIKGETDSTGRDGAFRSQIAQSAKDGKLDDWSTAPKGRANKRIATKQIRAFVKAETAKEIENSDSFSLDEYREAWQANEDLSRLDRAMDWANEDARQAERDLAFFRAQLATLRQEIAEIKGASAP